MELLPALLALHDRIRERVVTACERQAADDLARVVEDGEGDTVFAIDRISEHELVAFLDREVAPRHPLVLVAEGLPDGRLTLPEGTAEEDARWRLLVDPIDGTRGLMVQKRSGWILTGVAPNRGPETGLADIEIAVQTEIPLVKQHLCDQFQAVRGGGVTAQRINRLTGSRTAFHPRPSRAATIRYGYATISRFFPGARDVLAAIDDGVVRRALGTAPPGKALCFEDQYICTGGQLAGLMTGQDRFVADLRPLVQAVLARRGGPVGLCCHPYDLAACLIAAELGVHLTDPHGRPLNAPLDVETNVAWVGYANDAIRREVEPALLAELRAHDLLEAEQP